MRCKVSKHKHFAAFLLCLLLFMFSGCINTPPEKSLRFFSMDTLIQFKAYGDCEEALKNARERVEYLDSILDATDKDSVVSCLRDGQSLPQDLLIPLRAAKKIAAQTDGALDLTLYPLSDAWGFFSKNYSVPSAEKIEQLLANKGSWSLNSDLFHCAPQTKLDFGSVAKGYAATQAANILREYGVTSAVLTLGGNVQTIGLKPNGSPWVVSVTDPADSQGIIGNLHLNNEAAVTSGNYQRNFMRNGKLYHHILDPKTGCPAESGLISVTIVCTDSTTADGLSTAIFIIGKENALKLYKSKTFDFEMLLVTEKNEIFITEGLADRFEQTNQNYKQPQVLR